MANLPGPKKLAVAVVLRWPIVIAAIVLAALAGIVGGDVADSLSSGGFDDRDSESSRAETLLEEEFGAGSPHVVIVASSQDGVDAPDVVASGLALTEELAGRAEVAEAGSYWSFGSPPPMRSHGGDKALMFLRFNGTEAEILEHAGAIREELEGTRGPLTLAVGGQFATFDQVNTVIEEDLVRAEMIAFPITLILLVIVFGSVVAASLPLVIGGFAIVGTFLILEIIASFTEVSIFALNFTTAMGLGLAIDYSLLIVSRYREELDAGFSVNDAVARTVATAGRTVIFSAGAVASSLVALLVFQFSFLRSFAYAGIAVVGLAAVGAVVVLPAILALVGRNVNRFRVRTPRPEAENRGWGRIARFVMRRPIPIATLSAGLLIVLAIPFLGVELGFPDDRVLDPSLSTRQVGDVIREQFDTREGQPITIVAGRAGDPAQRLDEIDTYAAELSALTGIARVDAVSGSYAGGTRILEATPFHQRYASDGATYLSLVPGVEPLSVQGEDLVAAVRAVDQPFVVSIGGPAAILVDAKSGLFQRLPMALALIGLITFVVLFLSFGSILVPLKAIVLNLLSLTATFGALVWVFQEGRLEGVLGFTATGTLVMSMPILMFITAFGLSMDYEVFLLSRIKEEYDRTGDNEESVALGLQRSGRIVTAAAVLIAVVFVSFANARVSFMIMFGLGMALAVLVDAFIVRATLVPSLMRLAGRANWWAPKFLRPIYERFGFKEHVFLDDERIPVETHA